MKSQAKIFKTLLYFALMTASGCGGSSKTEVVSDTNTLRLEPIILQEPLNCPVMLTTLSGSNRLEKRDWLIFSFEENPDFDVHVSDDCKGDLKNIWTDLTRLEAQIESHMPYIKHVYSITSSLKHFPQTRKDLQNYMNKEATNSLLYDVLVQFDRSTLEGGMAFDSKVHEFIRINEDSYWMKEHAPIIEKVLMEYGLKMKSYSSEKNFYCYHQFDVCREGWPAWAKSRAKDLEFEYIGPAFDWLSFQEPVAEIDR